jgi:acyl dehydratase
MTTPSTSLEVGAEIAPLTLPPITRTVLAVYCGASGDHNPVHVDIDAAREAGFADVFAHGMLSMAYLGRLLTNTFEQFQLRNFTVRFTAITQVHDVVTCTGRVIKKESEGGHTLLTLYIRATTNRGTTTLAGEAVVDLGLCQTPAC